MTRLALLTDLHYRESVHDRLIPELETLVTKLNEVVNPDHLIVLGDIIHEGATATIDRKRAQTVHAVLNSVACPVRYLPGNHDVINLSPSSDWPAIFGHEPWGIDTEESFVFLDSTAPSIDGGQGSVSEEQLQELAAVVPSLSDALVFVHHPIHEQDVTENRWFRDRPEEAFCANRDAVHEILTNASTVAGTFNGHLHESTRIQQNGLDHFTVNAFNKQLAPSEAFGAFAVVDRTERLQVRLIEGDGTEQVYDRY